MSGLRKWPACSMAIVLRKAFAGKEEATDLHSLSKAKKITDPTTLARIQRLAIPPAWNNVWICSKNNGHIQATGIDPRGRKQYKYHQDWSTLRDQTKFQHLWQLVINTGTTIITVLMVFVIQQSQNKDSIALQLKLNELIASQKNASNRLIDIEDLTEDELEVLKKFYIKLSKLAKQEKQLYTTHSIDEAAKVHNKKQSGGDK